MTTQPSWLVPDPQPSPSPDPSWLRREEPASAPPPAWLKPDVATVPQGPAEKLDAGDKTTPGLLSRAGSTTKGFLQTVGVPTSVDELKSQFTPRAFLSRLPIVGPFASAAYSVPDFLRNLQSAKEAPGAAEKVARYAGAVSPLAQSGVEAGEDIGTGIGSGDVSREFRGIGKAGATLLPFLASGALKESEGVGDAVRSARLEAYAKKLNDAKAAAEALKAKLETQASAPPTIPNPEAPSTTPFSENPPTEMGDVERLSNRGRKARAANAIDIEARPIEDVPSSQALVPVGGPNGPAEATGATPPAPAVEPGSTALVPSPSAPNFRSDVGQGAVPPPVGSGDNPAPNVSSAAGRAATPGVSEGAGAQVPEGAAPPSAAGARGTPPPVGAAEDSGNAGPAGPRVRPGAPSLPLLADPGKWSPPTGLRASLETLEKSREARPLGALLRQYSDLLPRLQGDWLSKVSKVNNTGLSKAEFQNFFDTLDGKDEPINSKVASKVSGARSLLDQIKDRADSAGVFSGQEIDSYAPHMFDEPLDFDETARRYARANGITTEQAVQEMNGARSNRTGSGAQANLERYRGSDPDTVNPNYRTDPGVLPSYVSQASRRIASAEVFGKGGQVLDKALASIRDTDTRNFATKLVERMGLKSSTPESGEGLARAVGNVEALSHLPFAAPMKLTDMVRVYANSNLSSFARGMANTASDYAKAQDNALRAGSLHINLPDAVQSLKADTALEAGTGKFSWGIKPVDRIMRVVGDSVGREYIQSALEGGASDADLKQNFGVDPRKARAEFASKPGLSQETLDQAGKWFADRAAGTPDLLHVPQWSRSPIGRMASTFMSYAYQSARANTELVQQAFGRGNFLPLAKLLVVGAPVMGEAINDLKSIFQGYGVKGQDLDEKDPKLLANTLKTAFGSRRAGVGNTPSIVARLAQDILVGSGINFARDVGGRLSGFADPHLSTSDAIVRAAGPVAEDAAAGINTVKGIASGNLGEATRLPAAMIPFGSQFHQEVFQKTPPGEKTPQANFRPPFPGWVGRTRDAIEGRTTPIQAIEGGVTGGNLSSIRRQAQIDAQAAQRKQDQEAINKAKTVAPDKTTTMGAATGKNTIAYRRLQIISQIEDALNSGKTQRAEALADSLESRGLPKLTDSEFKALKEGSRTFRQQHAVSGVSP